MKCIIRNIILSLGLTWSVLNTTQAATVDALYFSPSGSVAVGSTFTLNILGDFTELAGGTIDFGYNGNLLQINSVAVAPVWDFLPGRVGSRTATGVNSQWANIGFDVFSNPPQAGTEISIATLNLTVLAAGVSSLIILNTSEVFSSVDILSPTFGSTSITAIVPTAVPLPPALWLLASGVLGLVGIGRRMTSSR